MAAPNNDDFFEILFDSVIPVDVFGDKGFTPLMRARFREYKALEIAYF